LRRLQVLRVLQQHQTVTGTARALHLTPSAVSQQVRLLGQDLGVELVRRHGRHIRLTPAAESLIAYTDDLYAGWEEVITEVRDSGSAMPVQQLRLCGFATGIAGVLAPATARLRQACPEVRVEIVEADGPESYARLLTGQADLALVVPGSSGPAYDRGSVEQHRLLDDPFDLVVPAGHPLEEYRSVDLADTAEETWVAAPDGSDQRRLMEAAWLAAGFRARVVHQARDWDAMVAMVGQRLGVCLLPRLAPLPGHQSVVRLPLRGQPAPYRRVFLAWRRGTARQPAIAEFTAVLDDLADALPPPLLDDERGEPHDDGPGRPPHRHTQRAVR
jgi:DNA-binding transcriptional LysR family regulator